MLRNKCLTVFFLLLCHFAVSSEAVKWVIAAESFTIKDVPSYYENFSEMVPRLILSRLTGINSRMILGDEKKERELRALSDQRIKLIRERSELIQTRDKILFSSEPVLVKQRKKSETSKKISDTETEIKKMDIQIVKFISAKQTHTDEVSSVKVWKSGSELYKRPANMTLSSALSNEKISGLLTGTIEDIAGYLYVTAQLETGLPGIPVVSIAEASSYDDIEALVASLSMRLLPEIANRKPVQLRISVVPETARVFIDGQLCEDISSPVTVFSGEHTVNVSASGYIEAVKTAQFTDSTIYDVSIALQKETLVSVSFDTRKLPASLFLHTQYFGETPQTIFIPSVPTIGEAFIGDIPTYFIFSPQRLHESENFQVLIRTNTVTSEKRIEKQRSVFYWSLGGLYLTLPVAMLSYGISMNKYQAYVDNKLDKSDAVVTDINNWSMTAQVSRNICIGLGVNVIVQLVRYLIAAEQATPKYVVETKKSN